MLEFFAAYGCFKLFKKFTCRGIRREFAGRGTNYQFRKFRDL